MLRPPLPYRLVLALGLAILLAACSSSNGPRPSPTASAEPTVGSYKLGKPYRINGKWYRPEYDPAYARTGTASWYGADFHGLATANGEVFDKEQITAAHPTLPLPSVVRVTNLDNGRSIEVRVNDRGPFVGDRLIDLSQAAARRLGYEERGLARVRVEFLGLADARGTPPVPTVTRMAAPAPQPVPRPQVVLAAATLPAAPAVQPRVPARAMPAAPTPVRAVAACSTGPQFIQVGAYAETDQVLAAMASLEGLGHVQVEPAFAGNKAVARVRLGPVSDPLAANRLLAQVAALGYTDAFVTPAPSRGGVVLVSC